MTSYYHLSLSIISRGDGRSAVACASYRSGQLLRDERYGKTHDYGRRSGIREIGITLPPEAPEWMRDREKLWNAVELAEKRKDAQLAREFVLAFPHQLDDLQRRELMDEFIQSEITSRGYVADWAIHAPNRAGDERNFHVHVMATMRTASADGFAPKKDRSLNTPDQLVRWREAWAEIQNRGFERYDLRDEAGRLHHVDHRSYKDRGVGREPTIHLGVHAVAIERRGGRTDRGDVNREIEKLNQARILVRRRAAELTRDEIQILAAANDRDPSRNHGFDDRFHRI